MSTELPSPPSPPPDSPEDALGYQTCTSCKTKLPLGNFHLRKKASATGERGTRTKTCSKCIEKRSSKKRKAANPDGDTEDQVTPEEVSLEDFLDTLNELSDDDGHLQIDAAVDVFDFLPPEMTEDKDIAHRIARELGDHLSLHWK